jgi:parallel beta-helix repeat protein
VTPPGGLDAIRVHRAPNVTIRGVDVRGGAIGVDVVDSTATVVTDVRVAGSAEGIRMRRCRADCEVSDSTIEGTTHGVGIRVRDSPGVTLSANSVRDTRREGIRVTRSAGLSLADNRVERSGADGIRISACDRVRELEGNAATANARSGLRLDGGFVDASCPACSVEENTAERNARYGVRVRHWARISAPSDLDENSASGNGTANFRVRP